MPQSPPRVVPEGKRRREAKFHLCGQSFHSGPQSPSAGDARRCRPVGFPSGRGESRGSPRDSHCRSPSLPGIPTAPATTQRPEEPGGDRPGTPPPLTPLARLQGADDVVDVEVPAGLVEAVHGHVEGLLLEDHMDALHGEEAAALGVAVAVEQRGPVPLVVAEEGQQHLSHLGVGGRHAGEVRVLAALGAEAGGQRARRQHRHVPVRGQPRHRRRRVLAHRAQQQVGPAALQGHHVHQAEQGAVAARRVLVGELEGVAGRQTRAALPQAPHRVLDGRPHPPQREEVGVVLRQQHQHPDQLLLLLLLRARGAAAQRRPRRQHAAEAAEQPGRHRARPPGDARAPANFSPPLPRPPRNCSVVLYFSGVWRIHNLPLPTPPAGHGRSISTLLFSFSYRWTAMITIYYYDHFPPPTPDPPAGLPRCALPA